MSINLIRDLGYSEDDPEIIEAQTIVAFEYFLKDAGMEDADAEASVKNFVRAIKHNTLMQAASALNRPEEGAGYEAWASGVGDWLRSRAIGVIQEEVKNDRA